MKKTYCDRCGKEVEQNNNIILRRKNDENNPFKADIEEYFDICSTCRDSFFGWIGGQPAEQEKAHKIIDRKTATTATTAQAAKPAKSAKNGKSIAFTVQQLAELSEAPVTTVRRHAEGICSTYSKDKQGRTIRRYHLTDDQLAALLERIKSRQQGKRTKI